MLDKLPQDILAELADPLFLNRSHYSRSTYADGCHGPLCSKAERDRARFRNKERAETSGRVYRPINRKLSAIAYDQFLDEVIAWWTEEYKREQHQSLG